MQVVQLMGNCMEAAFEGQHLRTADSAAALACPSTKFCASADTARAACQIVGC